MEKPFVHPVSMNRVGTGLLPWLKLPVRYTILFVILTIPFGALSLIPVNSGFSFWSIKMIQLLSFAGMGLLHLYTIENRRSSARFNFKNQLYYSISLSVAMCLALCLLYSFTDTSLLRMSFASSGAFLLPFIIKQGWELYRHIPEKQYEVWYPNRGEPDNRVSIFLNSIRIHFKLSRTYYDFEQGVFTTIAPLPISLGRLFDQFIARQNKQHTDAIECADENGNVYGWEFYVESFGGYNKNYLNPEKSILDNRIKKDAVITVKRVKMQVKKLTYGVPQRAEKLSPAPKNQIV